MATTLAIVFALLCALILYLLHVNRQILQTPPEAKALCQKPWTEQDVREAAQHYIDEPTNFDKDLPQKTGRRYIVVGGSGMVGGWIVQHLLERGEDAVAIRIMDLRTPQRHVVTSKDVVFTQTDVSDASAVSRAFEEPWPDAFYSAPLTVYHTVAYIKPYDRKADLLEPYLKVNVEGTRNVLAAARLAGCSIFIATSSNSVCLKRPVYFTAPWQKSPKNFFQIRDNADPETLDGPLSEYAGCYAYTKAQAEKLVRQADNVKDDFRTGVIRPGHAIYGHGDENPMSIAYNYLKRGGSPSWLAHFVVQFVSAQNVSLAHLLFEARLLSPKGTIDVGGKAYAISDPGPPMPYNNLYTLLGTLAHPTTPIRFPAVPPVPMLLLAHVVEFYGVMQRRCFPFLPLLKGDIETIQPALFNLSTFHVVYGTGKAHEELGYNTELGTMEGLCVAVKEWNQRVEAKLAGNNQAEEQKPIQEIEAGQRDVPAVLPARNL